MSEQAQSTPTVELESSPNPFEDVDKLQNQTDENVEEEEIDEEDGESGDEEQQELTPAQKKRLKKLKLKFNGKELEEELPFEIDDDPRAIEYMTRQLQLAKLSQTKAQEYAQLEKELKQFVEQLRSNPRKILSDPRLGIDLKKIAAEMIDEEVQQASKTPEQIEKEKLEQRLRELEEERNREKEELRQKEMERLMEQKYEQYDMQMSKALESSDLPKSPYVVKKMADLMILGVKNGLAVEPADVVQLVRDEMTSDLKEMFSLMPAEVIEQLIGDGYDKVRKHRLKNKKPNKAAAAVNANNQKKVEDVGISKTEKKEENINKKSFKDFFGV